MNVKQVSNKRVLLVRSTAACYAGIVDSLADSAQLREVDSLQEAVELLGREKFDLVLSDVSNLVPLEKALIAQQASTVLDAIGQSVCVVNRDGRFVWSNDKLSRLTDEARCKLADYCQELIESLNESQADREAIFRTRRFSLRLSNERYFEVAAAPIMTADEEVRQVAVIISEVTPTRRLQRKIDAIDRAGRELVRLDAQQIAKLDVTERLALLEQKIINFSRELMNFSNFAIWILDTRNNKLELLINSDLPPESVEVELYAATEGNGICGYVAATGRSYICPDVRQDPRYLQGIDGARSSLTVPLYLHDQVRGVLNVESVTPSMFTEDDRQFAEIFGRYVAIALNTFDLLVTEHVTTTGRVATNVECEIASPLNDIITDATTLMEEYIGHDDLRKGLQAICENVVKVKQAVKDVASPQEVLLGGRRSRDIDPVLDRRRVLVADDEEAIRETLSEVLTNYGCVVETARDGSEALSLLGERSYDLVLSDIKMPGKNGYEVFQAAKEGKNDCPVILMTGFGYDPNHSIIRARREGLAAVLFKPFKVDQLINELKSALQSSISTT